MPAYPKPKVNEIKYNSPSGKVFIGKYAPPFVNVKKGFGYYGVILLDKKSDQLQCHVCGKWSKLLSTHIWGTHKMLSDEYRKKFGLFKSTALVSEALRESRRVNMVKMRATGKMKFLRKFKENNKDSANRKGKPKAYEAKNKFGRCHAQLVNAIIMLKDKLKRTPSLTDIKKEYGGGFVCVLHYTYGSYPALCEKIGIQPLVSSVRPKYNRNYIIELAKDFYERYDRIPSSTDYNRGLFPDSHSIQRSLGVKTMKAARRIFKREIL